jgi:hypothetical protein
VPKLALVVLLAAVMPQASAQRLMSHPHFVSPRPGAHSHPFQYPIPFFSDYFDSAAEYSVAPQPPVIVLQTPAANPEPAPTPPVQPLLIELKGDRYVRVSGEEPAGAETIDEASALKVDGPSSPAIPNHDLAPVVLVFRDGHREEVTAYTIVDGALYAQGIYYIDGSWNRRIDLSSLNLPETIEASRSRGVNFRLPAAPNEVVTRP